MIQNTRRFPCERRHSKNRSMQHIYTENTTESRMSVGEELLPGYDVEDWTMKEKGGHGIQLFILIVAIVLLATLTRVRIIPENFDSMSNQIQINHQK